MAIYPSYKYNVSLNSKPSNNNMNNTNMAPTYENTNYTSPMEYEQNMQNMGYEYDMQNMNMDENINMNTDMGMDMNMNNMEIVSKGSYFPRCNDLSQRLIKAMTGERDARLYYQQLMNMTQSSDDRNVIMTFAEDEKKHYDNFNKLYMQMTGQQPVLPQPVMPRIPSYVEGLKKAIFDETDAYEFYRNTYMCIGDETAKEVFFEALTDENEHAIRLNYLYTKNK